MNDAHRIVQAFLLFKFVAVRIVQFPRTYYERSVRFIYTSRQLVQVRLANRSLVQIFPRLRFQTSANGSIHNSSQGNRLCQLKGFQRPAADVGSGFLPQAVASENNFVFEMSAFAGANGNWQI